MIGLQAVAWPCDPHFNGPLFQVKISRVVTDSWHATRSYFSESGSNSGTYPPPIAFRARCPLTVHLIACGILGGLQTERARRRRTSTSSLKRVGRRIRPAARRSIGTIPLRVPCCPTRAKCRPAGAKAPESATLPPPGGAFHSFPFFDPTRLSVSAAAVSSPQPPLAPWL